METHVRQKHWMVWLTISVNHIHWVVKWNIIHGCKSVDPSIHIHVHCNNTWKRTYVTEFDDIITMQVLMLCPCSWSSKCPEYPWSWHQWCYTWSVLKHLIPWQMLTNLLEVLVLWSLRNLVKTHYWIQWIWGECQLVCNRAQVVIFLQ